MNTPYSALFNTFDRLFMAIVLLNNLKNTFTVRELSAQSDLSLGFISKFSNLLRSAGFLDAGPQIKLKKAGALLDIIRDIYFFETQSLYSYYTAASPEETINKIKKIGKKRDYALTRMAGASKIAPFVRFQLVDFYLPSEKEVAFWKDQLKLTDVEISGNINLIVPSDKRILALTQNVEGVKIANNIQLYLDLYKYPARGREQAEYLRERILKI